MLAADQNQIVRTGRRPGACPPPSPDTPAHRAGRDPPVSAGGHHRSWRRRPPAHADAACRSDSRPRSCTAATSEQDTGAPLTRLLVANGVPHHQDPILPCGSELHVALTGSATAWRAARAQSAGSQQRHFRSRLPPGSSCHWSELGWLEYMCSSVLRSSRSRTRFAVRASDQDEAVARHGIAPSSRTCWNDTS